MSRWTAMLLVGVIAGLGVVWDEVLHWPFGFGLVAGAAYAVGLFRSDRD